MLSHFLYIHSDIICHCKMSVEIFSHFWFNSSLDVMNRIKIKIKENSSQERCPVCGSARVMEKYPKTIDEKKLHFTYKKNPESTKTFRVVKCLKCTHQFCWPLPQDIYKNYIDVKDQRYIQQEKSRKASAEKVLVLIRKYSPSGKVLDVGCATGDFLEIARKNGYSAEGLELSKWASDIVRKKGFLVHEKTLEEFSKNKKAQYDIITLFGVVEHFQYPMDEMKHLSTLLKPGGLLVVWTGDVNSVTSKILGKKWWYWQGQHLQYFTRKSLGKLASANKISTLEVKIYPATALQENIFNSIKIYRFYKAFVIPLRMFFMFKKSWSLYIPGEMLWIGRKLK